MKNRTMLRAVKMLNIVNATAVFAVAWYVFYADFIMAPFYRRGNFVIPRFALYRLY